MKGEKMKEKNNKKTFIVIVSVFTVIISILIFIIGLILFINPKKVKNPSYKELSTIVSNNNGCKMENYIDETTNKYAKWFYISNKNDCPYLISYIKFKDSKFVNDYYNKLENDVFNNNNNISGKTTISLGNYKQVSTSGDYYKFAGLNNDTILYISADSTYRESIIKLVEKLGYSYEPNWNILSIMFLLYLIIIPMSVIIIIVKIRVCK